MSIFFSLRLLSEMPLQWRRAAFISSTGITRLRRFSSSKERSFSTVVALAGEYQQKSYVENKQTVMELRKWTKEIFEAYNRLVKKEA